MLFLATTPDGKDVYLKDIWPTREEVAKFEEEFVKPQFFKEVSFILNGVFYYRFSSNFPLF